MSPEATKQASESEELLSPAERLARRREATSYVIVRGKRSPAADASPALTAQDEWGTLRTGPIDREGALEQLAALGGEDDGSFPTAPKAESNAETLEQLASCPPDAGDENLPTEGAGSLEDLAAVPASVDEQAQTDLYAAVRPWADQKGAPLALGGADADLRIGKGRRWPLLIAAVVAPGLALGGALLLRRAAPVPTIADASRMEALAPRAPESILALSRPSVGNAPTETHDDWRHRAVEAKGLSARLKEAASSASSQPAGASRVQRRGAVGEGTGAPSKEQVPAEAALRISLESMGAGAMVVPVRLRGRVEKTVKLLFDTGASFTTLRRDVAEALGLPNPQQQIATSTTAGTVATALTTVSSIGIGKAEIRRRFAVSICESCGHGEVVGLLGLNFIRHFRVSLDHERRELLLTAKRDRPAALYDIRPFVDFSALKLIERAPGSKALTFQVANRSAYGLSEVVVLAVGEGGAVYGKARLTLAAGATSAASVSLSPPAPGALSLRVQSARWADQ